MPKFASKRNKKRRFSGNRYSRCSNIDSSASVGLENSPNGSKDIDENNDAEQVSEQESASYRKLKTNIVEAKQAETIVEEPEGDFEPIITGYRFCDMEIMADVFVHLRCGECGQFSLVLMEDDLNRNGCASSLRLLCENCGWKHLFSTSKRQGKSFEVNRRLVYGMRALGKGHAGAKKFCSLMNIPPPPTARSFTKNSRVIGKHVKKVAKESMQNASKEIKCLKGQQNSDEPTDCAASFDGTWQRRGYSSHNGCVTAISMDTGKVIDVEALSVSCKQCQLHEHLDKNSIEYQRWRADHINCKANFKGSAPAMEPEGVDRMFKRSVEVNNLRYTEFFGDGDSKSFNRVKEVYQADGIIVEKRECIGHVQKRVGTALRKLKRDNPGLGGKGKLTDAQIDKLQNYYGIAIRSNVGNLQGMKKAIHASLFHCASKDAMPLHDHCPTGSNSWCKFQKDKANGTNTFKHGSGLPLNVIAKVKPEYVRLSDENLLNKCLHGKTQNQNESLNGMIWQRLPKEVYVGREILELGMYDAVAHFNIGSTTVLKLLQGLGISPGKYTQAGCKRQDETRVQLAQYKSQVATKKKRKVLRGNKKRKNDKNKQAEGLTYAPGQF